MNWNRAKVQAFYILTIILTLVAAGAANANWN